MHDAASTRSRPISTMQARQLPSRAIARQVDVAEIRDFLVSSLLADLPDGLALVRRDGLAVQREFDLGVLFPVTIDDLTEVNQQRFHRIGRGLTQAADRKVAHHRAEVAQPGLVERPPLL